MVLIVEFTVTKRLAKRPALLSFNEVITKLDNTGQTKERGGKRDVFV